MAIEKAAAQKPTSAMIPSMPAGRRRRVKEPDPTMVRLRETVRSHDDGGPTPLEALATKQHHQRRHGRKGRRRMAELHSKEHEPATAVTIDA